MSIRKREGGGGSPSFAVLTQEAKSSYRRTNARDRLPERSFNLALAVEAFLSIENTPRTVRCGATRATLTSLVMWPKMKKSPFFLPRFASSPLQAWLGSASASFRNTGGSARNAREFGRRLNRDVPPEGVSWLPERSEGGGGERVKHFRQRGSPKGEAR